jgi:hypothetical protein
LAAKIHLPAAPGAKLSNGHKFTDIATQADSGIDYRRKGSPRDELLDRLKAKGTITVADFFSRRPSRAAPRVWRCPTSTTTAMKTCT